MPIKLKALLWLFFWLTVFGAIIRKLLGFETAVILGIAFLAVLIIGADSKEEEKPSVDLEDLDDEGDGE